MGSHVCEGPNSSERKPDLTGTTTELQISPPSASPRITKRDGVREIVTIPCKYGEG